MKTFIFILIVLTSGYISAQITGIITTNDNGVNRVTNNQDCNNATIIGETIILDNINSRLRATSATGLLVESSQIKCDADITGSNDNNAPITYGNRSNTTSKMRITENSSILFSPLSTRKNIFLSELSESEIIESNNTGQLFVYTQTDAILKNCVFKGISVWEVYRSPSIASGIIVENANYGYLNWEAGRLDFLGFTVNNIAISHAWLGAGNGGNNSVYHWNNDSNFDNTKLRLQSTNNRYFEGKTISWEFIDRDTSNPVSDVLVNYSDDISGINVQLAQYLTNANGRLQGTFSTQTKTTVSDQELTTLFVLQAYSDITGSTNSSGGGNTYDIVPVTSQIEIRSYLHDKPDGYGNADNLILNAPKGVLNADYTVNTFESFLLTNDTQITETNINTALAYTELEDIFTFYDRAKAEWRINDNYPLISRNNNSIDAGSYDIVIDATAPLAYTFSGNTITIKASVFSGDITTTGTVTLLNGAVISGALIDENSDSFIKFENVNTWSVYNSENDVLSNTNSIESGTGVEGYKFNFTSGTTYYLGLTNSNNDRFVYRVTPTTTGITTVSYTESINSFSKKLEEITVLLENQSILNANVKKASLIIPATVNTNTLAISNTTGTLSAGNPAGGISDSELSFSGVANWYVYNSENDAISGVNLLATDIGSTNYEFTFTTSIFFYLAVYTNDGARLIQKITPSISGITSISFDDTAILSNLDDTINTLRANQKIINNNVKKASLVIPASDDVEN